MSHPARPSVLGIDGKANAPERRRAAFALRPNLAEARA
jgi:hypothetical protein